MFKEVQRHDDMDLLTKPYLLADRLKDVEQAGYQKGGGGICRAHNGHGEKTRNDPPFVFQKVLKKS